MLVRNLLDEVRRQIADVEKVEYTDAELIGYINDGLRFISNELIRLNSPLLIKFVNLTLSNGEATLPSDFVKEEAVLDAQGNNLVSVPPAKIADPKSYKIIGNKLYSGNKSVTLFYYAPFQLVSGLDDLIPVPVWMESLLKEIVVFLALNRNEFNVSVEQALIQAFGQQIWEIAKSIGGQNFERPMPFVV